MRYWEEIRSVNDRDEFFVNMEVFGSFYEEGDEIVIVELVFIIEGVIYDLIFILVLVRKDREEWFEEKMIINIIENEDDFLCLVCSLSFGSKMCIFCDIFVEFCGDFFGRKIMFIVG